MFEVPTSRGLAYAQLSHRNKLMGALVRILPGLHRERPSDLSELARQPTAYFTFFPLEAAVRGKQVTRLGRVDVPPHAQAFPLFRAAGQIEPGTGKVLDWWLWDGEREWRIGQLTHEQRDLPLREVVMPPMLIERLELGWTPRNSEKYASEAEDVRQSQPTEARPAPTSTWRHFLYFPSESRAAQAADTLRGAGYIAHVEQSADDDWLVVVQSQRPTNPRDERQVLERIARRFEGLYDGWEAAVSGPP